jgi:hypothetical protein
LNLLLDAKFPVRESDELRRVAALPRRIFSAGEQSDCVRDMTRALKTPQGTMELWPVQAQALLEIGTLGGGLFAPQTVGAGKTLISFLAPVVAFAGRPLLVVPANLVKKTERDRRILSPHFRIAEFIRIMTYDWLGTEGGADALDQYMADFFVFDEAHHLRNFQDAAVARRVRRHISVNRRPCVILSGTITGRSLHDYAHLIAWALGLGSPLPLTYEDLESWSDALDEKKGEQKSSHPGALRVFCNDEENRIWDQDPQTAARQGFRRRLVETPGVVATDEAEVNATITMTAVDFSVSPLIDSAFEFLRRDWQVPGGAVLSEPMHVHRVARELSMGMCYLWDPPAPKEWLSARKAWCAYVRTVLAHSQRLDSELQVRNWAAEKGDCLELAAWLEIKDTFEPNSIPVWIDDSALKFAAEWANRERGIVWVEHVCVGQRLEQDFGLSYYHELGLDSRGNQIEDHDPKSPMVASIASNSEGRNLQAWNRNLIMSIPPNGARLEQLLGRTHRPGQKADDVRFDFVNVCAEHLLGFWQCVADSRYVQQTIGSRQKVLLAGWDVPGPESIVFNSDARWDKTWGRSA